ncbi:hypothetical protein TSOC_004212 [Tetrabaena socialis]|uniref:AAA+ ATPase domain-containing protein n=1 Tax=Tetrabaena socialis TaxID=47790 RepID=A0A2J8A9K2_9CHLO|nr:hypothetical protein TSOC_004212 [Tetrabaena socialis]|eukprot:PNH09163.1 hypothetical protein TSOC_004212 [Tetrabaena socialis]
MARKQGISTGELYENLNMSYQDIREEEKAAKAKKQKQLSWKRRHRMASAIALAKAASKDEVWRGVHKRNQEFFDRLSEEDQDYVLDIKIAMTVRYKTGNGQPHTKVYNINKVVKKKDAHSSADSALSYEKQRIQDESGVHEVVDAKVVSHELTKVNPKPHSLLKTKMRDAHTLMIDGDDKQVWDRKQGTCVYDYLIHRFANIKCFKRTPLTYESLDHIFREYDEIDGVYLRGSALKTGVSAEQIELFCRRYRISMYALDQENMYFHIYQPPEEKRNHNTRALIFKVTNEHFYPVPENAVKSLKKAISNALCKTDVVRSAVPSKGEEVVKKAYSAIHAFEEVTNPMSILVNVLSEKLTQPLSTSIYYDGDIRSFELNNELYLINPEAEEVKCIYERLGTPYSGQNINTGLFDIIEHIAKMKIPKSSPNPHVNATLMSEGIKARSHIGCVNGFDEKSIRELEAAGRVTCSDISKSHSNCLYSPVEDWIVLGFNDCWEDYRGDCSKLGLYYIETDDKSLFHGNNIYSNSILAKARAEGIPFEVTQQLLCSDKLPGTFFRQIIDAIVQVAGGRKDLIKKLINLLAGWLGKHLTKHYRAAINTDLNSAWTWLQKYGSLESPDIFVTPFEIPALDNKTAFLYGQAFQTTLSEHNIPMYIQVADQRNIELYEMSKAMGGTLAYRKVDCAATIGGAYPPLSDAWGGYRKADLPKALRPQIQKNAKFVEARGWTVPGLKDSDQWEDIMDLVQAKGGLLLQGRAGTGKTYCAKQIARALIKQGLTVDLIAPTNKAALNIQGKTIHKYLRMDQSGKISGQQAQFVRDHVDVIIVDEISMIGKYLWKRLVELKKATKVIFILLGDHRHTRKSTTWAPKGLKSKTKTKTETDIKEPPRQGKLTVNNEYFCVTKVVDEMVTCQTTRSDSEGNPKEHLVECPLDDFHGRFLVNYAMTVHKTQGETFTAEYTIWDWGRMPTKLKYTALSRAKKPDQVFMMTSSQLLDSPVNVVKEISSAARSSIVKKIQAHQATDSKRGLETNVDLTFVESMIKAQGGLCHHCHTEVKLDCYSKQDPVQLSLDRVDNTRGHIKSNLVLSCWGCNRSRQNKKL